MTHNQLFVYATCLHALFECHEHLSTRHSSALLSLRENPGRAQVLSKSLALLLWLPTCIVLAYWCYSMRTATTRWLAYSRQSEYDRLKEYLTLQLVPPDWWHIDSPSCPFRNWQQPTFGFVDSNQVSLECFSDSLDGERTKNIFEMYGSHLEFLGSTIKTSVWSHLAWHLQFRGFEQLENKRTLAASILRVSLSRQGSQGDSSHF